MKKLKQSIIIIFSLLIVFSMTSGVSFAQNDKRMSAIDKLEAFEILKRPEDSNAVVKRKDIIPIIIECIGLEDVVNEKADTTPFLDVDVNDSNIGAYNCLYDMGYIKGTDGRYFLPERELTANEAATLIMRMFGYDVVGMQAASIGMFEDVECVDGGTLVFADLYTMIYNSLFASVVENDGQTVELLKDTSILNDRYDIFAEEGVISANSQTGLYSAGDNVPESHIKLGNNVFENTNKKYDNLLGKNVLLYYKQLPDGSQKVVYIEEYKNEVTVIKAEDINKVRSNFDRIYYATETAKEKYVQLEAGVVVVYNGVSYSGYGPISNIFPNDGEVLLIDNDKDNKYEVINVTSYENYIVGYINLNSEEIVEKITDATLSLNSENNNVIIYDLGTGKEITFSQLQPNDVLTVAKSKNATGKKQITVYVSRTVVEGKITSLRTDNGKNVYGINDAEYIVAQNLAQNITAGREAAITVGETVKLYIDYTGKIAAVERVVSSDGYLLGVVTRLRWNTDDEKLYIRLFNQNAQWVLAPVAEKVKIDGGKVSSTESLGLNVTNAVATLEVIRYKYTGGEITDIDTETPNHSSGNKELDKGNLSLIASGTRFNHRFSLCSDNTDISKAWYIKSNDVIIFKVPAAGNIDDEDAYAVEKSLSTYVYGPQPATAHEVVNYCYVEGGYKAFNTSYDDINKAQCILLKDCDVSVAVSAASTFYLVSEAEAVGLKEDGEVYNILKLVTNGIETEMYAHQTVSYAYKEGGADSTEVNINDINLERGDVVQVGRDTEGIVNFINVVYRDGEPRRAGVSTYNQLLPLPTWNGHYSKMNSSASGTLISASSEYKMIKFKTYDVDASADLLYHSMATSPAITLYNKTDDTITKGTLSELLPTDKLIMNMNYSHSIKELIVIRD